MKESQPAPITAARRHWSWSSILLAVSGLLPLLGLTGQQPDPTLLIYSLFVVIWLWRRLQVPFDQAQPIQPTAQAWWRLPIAVIGSGLVVECLSWSNNYMKCAPTPALLHPQLFADLLLAIGFYGSWALVWSWLIRRYHWTLKQTFVIQGLFGILIEQQGQILLLGLTTLPIGLIFWLYVFLVYGSVMGIAYLMANPSRPLRRGARHRGYVEAALALAVCSVLINGSWGGVLRAAHVVPTPQRICERPLW